MALRKYLPRKTWIPITEIYGIVKQRIALDAEDLQCPGTRSSFPRWQSNVRRILHSKQREGTLRGRKSLLLRRDRPSSPST
jgi:hypothetical protein